MIKVTTRTPLIDNFVRAFDYYKSKSGKTGRDIAKYLNTSAPTVSNWGAGKHLPDMEKLQNLADYLGAPIDSFFDFSQTFINPDPLQEEMEEIYSKLSTEDRILLRDVALRILQLQER